MWGVAAGPQGNTDVPEAGGDKIVDGLEFFRIRGFGLSEFGGLRPQLRGELNLRSLQRRVPLSDLFPGSKRTQLNIGERSGSEQFLPSFFGVHRFPLQMRTAVGINPPVALFFDGRRDG